MGINFFDINKLTYVEIEDIVKGAINVGKERAQIAKMKMR